MSVLIKGLEIPRDYEVKIILCPNGQVFVDNGVFCSEYEAVEVPTPHGRLIDADAIQNEMYHKSFETDDERQKWDSGLWIRYKIFEEAVTDAPTVIESEE